MTTVERIRLGGDLEIARVLTGLWQLADMERDGRRVDPTAAAGAMTPYAEAGFTTFDMADHYGSAEDIAGLFRSDSASERKVELLTKWVPQPGPVAKDGVRAAVARSLQRLRSERIDLLQFHAWTFADPSWLDALFWLEELREEGLIRHLGVTNFDTAHLRVAVETGIRLVTNQVSFSLLDQRAAGAMSEYCLARGIKLLAYGTLAGGFLSRRFLGAPEPDWAQLETWSQMKYGRFLAVAGGWSRFQALLSGLAAIAERHRVSIANVASRYILESPAVGGIIIGARLGQTSHLDDNLALFRFRLTPDDRAEIARAVAMLTPIPGDCGDEYRRPPYLTASGDLGHHVDRFPPPYQVRDQPGGTHCLTGTVWETIGGFSRAVRRGNQIWVAGTTATHGVRPLGGSDPAAQFHACIDKIEGALLTLGSRLEHVVRTRVFLRDMAQWEPVTRAHGERFRAIGPANTLVQAGLVGDDYLVEVEAEAIVP